MLYERLRALFPIGLIVLLLTVCDDIEGANQEEEGEVTPVGTTAVLWAKPAWAKYVNSRCPEDYTQLNTEFCFKCPDGYTFASFPDDDFCYQCSPGYSIGSWTDERNEIHYACYPPAPQQ